MAARLSAISLFSGAGGMDVGFDQAGFDIIWANDIDSAACETYRLNGLGEIKHGSLIDHWGDLERHGQPDIVFGGPPCQGFSVAGKMDPLDSRNGLIMHYFDVVERAKPTAFVCENVKGLAALPRWANFRRKLLERVDKIGYDAALLVLNATDFGVPQARERMFLIGFRKDKFKFGNIDLKALLLRLLEVEKSVPPTMTEIIRKLGPAGSLSNPKVCNAKVTFAKNPVLRRSPYAGMLFNGAGRPVKPFGHSATLPASMGGNKTPIVDEAEIFDGKASYIENYHRHLTRGGAPRSGKAPNRLRRLTIDECLAIQTFPDDFLLAGQQSAQYRQIGNAVPCKLANAVATTVNTVIREGAASLIEAMDKDSIVSLAS